VATVQTLYPSGYTKVVSFVNTAAAIATSSGFTGGGETDTVSNVSNLDLDHIVTGCMIADVSFTANTQCQLWVVPCQTDDLASSVTWPDVFDGTASTETVTSYGVLQGCGRLAQVLNLTSGGTNFFFEFSVGPLFGGSLPTRYVIFATHNSGHDMTMSSPSLDTSQFMIERFQATVA
jgi:hypothetical protein